MHRSELQTYKNQIKDIKKEINRLSIPQEHKKFYLDKLKGKKKDVTAYNCYHQNNRHNLALLFPQNNRNSILKKVAESWKNLPDIEKEQYEKLAAIINLQRAEQATNKLKRNEDINSEVLNI